MLCLYSVILFCHESMHSEQDSRYYFKSQRSSLGGCLAGSYKHLTVSFALQAFYQIFADHNDGFSSLDYTDMVTKDQINYLSFPLFKECFPVTYSLLCYVMFWLTAVVFCRRPRPLGRCSSRTGCGCKSTNAFQQIFNSSASANDR